MYKVKVVVSSYYQLLFPGGSHWRKQFIDSNKANSWFLTLPGFQGSVHSELVNGQSLSLIDEYTFDTEAHARAFEMDLLPADYYVTGKTLQDKLDYITQHGITRTIEYFPA